MSEPQVPAGVQRRGVMDCARGVEEECLKLLTELATLRTRQQEAGRESHELEGARGDAARSRVKAALERVAPAAREEVRDAYLEMTKVVFGLGAAKERQKLLGEVMEREGTRLDGLQRAVIELNALVRSLDGSPAGDPAGSPPPEPAAADLERTVLTAQEDEKKRVSIVIHDGPAQILANLIMRIDFCARLMAKDPEKAKGELVSLRKEMQDLLDSVRRLIFDLRPMALDDLGLVATIQRFVENVKPSAGFDLQLVLKGQPERLEPLAEVVAYRVVQEAVANVGQHAAATRAWIRLKFQPGTLDLQVEDNGRGFDAGSLPTAVGMGRLGLHTARKRVELVRGTFTVTSNPGSGTVVSARVPTGPRP